MEKIRLNAMKNLATRAEDVPLVYKNLYCILFLAVIITAQKPSLFAWCSSKSLLMAINSKKRPQRTVVVLV